MTSATALDAPTPAPGSDCRICTGRVRPAFDFGSQPVSNGFVASADAGREATARLAVGVCEACAMVQLLEERPREDMFRTDYPFRSSGSAVMCKHFADEALRLQETELLGPDDLLVEIGSNDGVLLGSLAQAGVRHLGVDPSAGAVAAARDRGARVRLDFFEVDVARDILATEGPAKVVFSANTFSHVPYVGSVLAGVAELLVADGVFVIEDRYLGDIVANTAFDQIYDEHFYLFGVHSVQGMAARHDLELVDVERVPVHGGSMRYTLARTGARPVAPSVHELLAEERSRGLDGPGALDDLVARIDRVCGDFVALLERLRAEGRSVVGFGATSKSATVLNYCGIGPDLLPVVVDNTPEKQGLLTPGTHIPVVSTASFAPPYPDYAVLFAWNHAEEIVTRERGFREAGGRWITYVPDVRVL